MESEQVNNIFIPCNCVIVHVDSLQRSKLLYKKLFISPGDWRNRTMEHVPLKSHTTMCQHFKPLPDSYSAGVKHRERAELLSCFGSQKKKNKLDDDGNRTERQGEKTSYLQVLLGDQWSPADHHCVTTFDIQYHGYSAPHSDFHHNLDVTAVDASCCFYSLLRNQCPFGGD